MEPLHTVQAGKTELNIQMTGNVGLTDIHVYDYINFLFISLLFYNKLTIFYVLAASSTMVGGQ